MTMRPDWAQPWFNNSMVSVETAKAAKKHIEELEAVFEKGHGGNVALRLAGLYEELGDKNMALTWLERALEHKAPSLCDLSRCVYHKSLQSEPRYQAVLRKIGFK